MLSDNHDSWTTNQQSGILGRRLLRPAGHHETYMDSGLHVVPVDSLLEQVLELGSGHPYVEADSLGAGKQAVEVATEMEELAITVSDTLPDSIPDKETRVEHGDLRIWTSEPCAVDVDQYIIIARIGESLVGAWRHGTTLAVLEHLITRERCRSSQPATAPINRRVHIRQSGRLIGWENITCRFGCRCVGSHVSGRLTSIHPKTVNTYAPTVSGILFVKFGLLPEGAYVFPTG